MKLNLTGRLSLSLSHSSNQQVLLVFCGTCATCTAYVPPHESVNVTVLTLFCLLSPSVSPFCIGQIQLGHLRLTAFRYCKPTPYLARVDTGLYKRMRWNVEMVGDEQQLEAEEELGGESEEREAEAVRDTE